MDRKALDEGARLRQRLAEVEQQNRALRLATEQSDLDRGLVGARPRAVRRPGARRREIRGKA